MPNIIYHRYQLEQSNFVFRDVRWYFSFLSKANSEDPDQTPRSVASCLGMQCLSMSHKKGRYAYKDKKGTIQTSGL